MLMENLIILQNVSKFYNKRNVLSNINLSISKGETLAIVGANGAGKSTLLKIIGGLTTFSKGKRILCKEEDKLRIGYVPDNFPKLNFTPCEYISYMGKMEGFSEEFIKHRSEELFDIFNIASMKNTRIKNLSKGSIQKVAVIQSIISKPDILLLDEPLSGQDNESQNRFVFLLQDLKAEGISIVLACHEMYFVNKLADKVMKIENGNILPTKFHDKADNGKMLISFRISKYLDLNSLNDFNGVLKVEQHNQSAYILLGKQYSDACIFKLLKAGCSIISVKEIESKDSKENFR